MMIRLSLRSRLRSAIAVTAMVGLVVSQSLPAQAQVYQPAPIPGGQAPGAMPASAAPGQAEPSQGWPREIPSPDGLRILMYQPQIDSWDSYRLQSKAALAVSRGPGGELSYGVAYFSARTDVDKNARQVFLQDVQVARLVMPGDPQLAAPVKAALEQRWAGATRTMSLDRLQASLAASQAWKNQQQAVEVDNTPPNILFSTTPAVLVLIDGAPVLQPVLNSRFERVVNTNALLLKHSTSGRFYLRVAGLWAGAPSLEGPWVIERAGLAELDAIKQAALNQAQVDILDDDDQPGPYGVLPTIYISSVPAELLQSDGEPQYAPIDFTRLLYVANSVSDIFVDTGSQEFYVLVSGRWFRARGVDGPWAYVDSTQLPADFRRIPEEHPKGDVLASIAGTPQAQEAAIANTIPQTATVDRQAPVDFQPVYDGDPQFQPVEGTPLYYAVNAPMPVVRVDPASYYAVYNGVWYTGPSPVGPWVVAYIVPPVIYTIPPRSPIYYCTYVRVFGYSPRYVHVGYTPGYFGTYITPRGTVVYGAGYRYRPWVGRAYYPRPASYGYGAAFVSGGFAGFALGLATAAIVSAPFWGPYWGWHHDRDRDRRDGRRDAGRQDNRRDGDWRGQRNFSSNVYVNQTNTTIIVNNNAPAQQSGAAASRAQPAAAAPPTSQRERERERRAETMRRDSQAYREAAARSRSGQPQPQASSAAPAQTQAGRAQTGQAQPGQAQAAGRNDVFVGADGKVYRRGEQGWERNERNRWTPAEARRTTATPAARTPAASATPAPAAPAAQAPAAAAPTPAAPAAQTPAAAAPQRPGAQRPGEQRPGVGPSATGQTGLNRADEAAGDRGQQGRDQARAAQERAAAEKAAADKAAQDKAAADRAAQQRAIQERANQERAAREKAAADKAVQDKAAADRAAAQGKAAQEKAAQDRARQQQDQANQARQQQERAAREKAAQDKAAQDRARAESQRQQEQSRREAAERARQQQQPAPQPAARPAPQPAPQSQAQRPAPAARPQPQDDTRAKLEAERAARAAGEAQTNANRNRPAPDAFVPPDRDRGGRGGRGNGNGH